MKLLRVKVVHGGARAQLAGKEERELRQRARRARRETRHDRREDRLEDRAQEAEREARQERRDDRSHNKPKRRQIHQEPQRSSEARPSRPASSQPAERMQRPPMAPSRGPSRGAGPGQGRAPGPLRAPPSAMARRPAEEPAQSWDEPELFNSPLPPLEEEPFDEPAEEWWNEEGEVPEGDDSEEQVGRGGRHYGDAGQVRTRLQEAVKSVLPGARLSPPLKVGSLEVRAPVGKKGLVLPLDEGVYLVGSFDEALVAKEGKNAVASAMIQAARIKLAPAQPSYGVGAIAVPLVLALLKARREEAQAQAAVEPTAAVQPVVGCNGQRCSCGR